MMEDPSFQEKAKKVADKMKTPLLSKLNPAAAFNPSASLGGSSSVARRQLLTKVLSASALLGAAAANAEIDYSGVGYLGGAKNIDVNNANVRVYQKLPGMYPAISGKIISNAPYKNKDEMYTKAKLEKDEIDTVKKYDSTFLFLEPKPEYIIDNINNGLYRR